MTRFVVDIGDIDLPKDMHDVISADLQKTVLGHVAKLRWDEPIVVKFPRDWWGLIIRKRFDAILDAEKLNQRALLTAQGAM